MKTICPSKTNFKIRNASMRQPYFLFLVISALFAAIVSGKALTIEILEDSENLFEFTVEWDSGFSLPPPTAADAGSFGSVSAFDIGGAIFITVDYPGGDSPFSINFPSYPPSRLSSGAVLSNFTGSGYEVVNSSKMSFSYSSVPEGVSSVVCLFLGFTSLTLWRRRCELFKNFKP